MCGGCYIKIVKVAVAVDVEKMNKRGRDREWCGSEVFRFVWESVKMIN